VVFDRKSVGGVHDGGRPGLLNGGRALDRVSGAEVFALVDAEVFRLAREG
jgi:hypothetical protein